MALYPGESRDLPVAGILLAALAVMGLLWLVPQPDPPGEGDEGD